jgi:hypothetical protein
MEPPYVFFFSPLTYFAGDQDWRRPVKKGSVTLLTVDRWISAEIRKKSLKMTLEALANWETLGFFHRVPKLHVVKGANPLLGVQFQF